MNRIQMDRLDLHVVFGQVGTIVEELGNNVFEVEFADKTGVTPSLSLPFRLPI